MRTVLKYAVVAVVALALGLVGGYLYGREQGIAQTLDIDPAGPPAARIWTSIDSLKARVDQGFAEIAVRLRALENPVPKAVPLDRP